MPTAGLYAPDDLLFETPVDVPDLPPYDTETQMSTEWASHAQRDEDECDSFEPHTPVSAFSSASRPLSFSSDFQVARYMTTIETSTTASDVSVNAVAGSFDDHSPPRDADGGTGSAEVTVSSSRSTPSNSQPQNNIGPHGDSGSDGVMRYSVETGDLSIRNGPVIDTVVSSPTSPQSITTTASSGVLSPTRPLPSIPAISLQAEIDQLTAAVKERDSQLRDLRLVVAENQAKFETKTAATETEFEALVNQTQQLLNDVVIARVKLRLSGSGTAVEEDANASVSQDDGTYTASLARHLSPPIPNTDSNRPANHHRSATEGTVQLVASTEDVRRQHGDSVSLADTHTSSSGTLRSQPDQVKQLQSLLRTAYEQLDRITEREKRTTEELATAKAREAELSVLAAASSISSQDSFEEDSTSIRQQLSALNARMEDFCFNLLEKVGVSMFLEGRVEEDIVARVMSNDAFRGYARLAKAYGTERVKAVTLSDFLMAGFLTVMCRSIDKLVFSVFKIGLSAEEEKYLSGMYSRMDHVPQDKVAKWRSVTYQTLPTADDAVLASAITESLLEHFVLVLSAIYPSQPPIHLHSQATELQKISKDAIRWRAKTRETAVGDFEPFLDFDSDRNPSRPGSIGSEYGGYRVDTTSPTSSNSHAEGVLGYRGFGLAKFERTRSPGSSGKIEKQQTVLLAGLPILEAE